MKIVGSHTSYLTLPWTFIPNLIEWQRAEREKLLETHDPTYKVVLGINFSIILSSACFIEGVFEDAMKRSVSMTPRGTNFVYGRFLDEMENRISKTTGIQGYNDIFKILYDSEVKELVGSDKYENIDVLFTLRNKLAHARSFHFHFSKSDGFFWEEKDSGKKIESFLIKKELIRKHNGEIEPLDFFSAKVADFFWTETNDFLLRISEAVEEKGNKDFAAILS